MNILLNIFGIGFVIYAVMLFVKSPKAEEKEITNIEDEKFNPDKFIEEINSFSKVLDDKKDVIEEKKIEKNIKAMDADIYTPSKPVEKEIDMKEDPGYTSLVKDVSKNRKTSVVGNSNNEILSLKDIGLSNKEIAKRTGRSIREIEVILKIYDKK